MKSMANAAGLDATGKKLTNHSVRKTTVRKLQKQDIPNSYDIWKSVFIQLLVCNIIVWCHTLDKVGHFWRRYHMPAQHYGVRIGMLELRMASH